MTVLTKGNQQRLIDAADSIVGELRRKTVYAVDTKTLALLFMTQDDIDEVSNFLKKYNVDHNYVSPEASIDVEFTHPITGKVTVNVPFTFQPVSRHNTFIWLKGEFEVRADADPVAHKEISESLAFLVQQRSDISVYQQVLTFICECRSIETMRYLFPPILRVFFRAGLGDIARRIADVKRVPPLPPIDGRMRALIKHANQWAAMQEMLGTFTESDQVLPRTHMRVTPSNTTYSSVDADGRTIVLEIS